MRRKYLCTVKWRLKYLGLVVGVKPSSLMIGDKSGDDFVRIFQEHVQHVIG